MRYPQLWITSLVSWASASPTKALALRASIEGEGGDKLCCPAHQAAELRSNCWGQTNRVRIGDTVKVYAKAPPPFPSQITKRATLADWREVNENHGPLPVIVRIPQLRDLYASLYTEASTGRRNLVVSGSEGYRQFRAHPAYDYYPSPETAVAITLGQENGEVACELYRRS